jgi:integrase
MYEGRKVKYIAAGTRADAADAQRKRLEQRETALVVAADAGLVVVKDEARLTLKGTASAYIVDTLGRGATEAAEQARLVTSEFIGVCRKRKKEYIDEITRDDIYTFWTTLRARGCGPRTVANKHARLNSWLKFAGLDKSMIPPKPRYEDTLPTIYEPDETATLLANADKYMEVCILIGLKCGLRDQELQHLEFSDLNWAEGTLRVQGKPRWGFHVKTWEQRDIPVPDAALAVLRHWEQARPGQTLVLGTSGHNPNTKLLLRLKGLARQAGLNCGRCDGCHERGECREFTLHKFRRTYITTLLRQGIDLRTVQAYAGHKDIASTMRYLRPASGTEARSKVNAVTW